MGPYADIVSLNNTGVALLRDGDQQEALIEFTRALSCLGLDARICDREMNQFVLKESLDLTRFTAFTSWLAHARSIVVGDHAALFLRSVSFVEQAEIEEGPLPYDPSVSSNNFFTLFNRAFSVFENVTPSLDTQARLIYLPCILPALFYNIGLIYHREAIRYDRAEMFSEALDLYTTSLHLLGGNASCSIPSCNLLLLGLFNNIGHIHSHFNNEVQTLYCRDQLTAVFLSTDCTRLLTKDEFVFFYMNVLFAVRRFPIIAPAA
jgi:hypothetical protein